VIVDGILFKAFINVFIIKIQSDGNALNVVSCCVPCSK